MTVIDNAVLEGPYEGVRRKRVLAFLIDFTLVTLLWLAASVVVFFLGVITFGLAWLLYGGLFPIIAILYSGACVGGEHNATPGMRSAGLVFRLENGERPLFLHGAVHVILFYVSVTFLTPLILIVSFFNSRKRMLHDMLIGAVIANAR